MDEFKDVSDNSWFAWSKHVLMQLEQDTKCMLEIKKDINAIKIEIAQLKVKSGVWGLIGGAIPVAVGLAIWLLTKN